MAGASVTEVVVLPDTGDAVGEDASVAEGVEAEVGVSGGAVGGVVAAATIAGVSTIASPGVAVGAASSRGVLLGPQATISQAGKTIRPNSRTNLAIPFPGIPTPLNTLLPVAYVATSE
jgi:hypothetical protein